MKIICFFLGKNVLKKYILFFVCKNKNIICIWYIFEMFQLIFTICRIIAFPQKYILKNRKLCWCWFSRNSICSLWLLSLWLLPEISIIFIISFTALSQDNSYFPIPRSWVKWDSVKVENTWQKNIYYWVARTTVVTCFKWPNFDIMIKLIILHSKIYKYLIKKIFKFQPMIDHHN